MDYKEHIAKAVEYIEANIKGDINLAECARVCGYSDYHFLRIFKAASGLTPADYIRKRKLSEVAKRICDNDQYISEIAFEYGFNSKENFVRAFKAEHHILPSEYKLAQNSLKLYERLSFDKKILTVEPEFIRLNEFSLTVYKSDEEYIPDFWNKYNAKKLSYLLSGGRVCEDYGVSVWNSRGYKVDYYIGIRSEEAKGNLSGTQTITIDKGLYAMFKTPQTTHADFVNTIHSTWEYINTIWLPQSEYKTTDGFQFESYIEASRIFSEKIYIPIVKSM
jgi:AraC family transcriptional regulator